MNSVIFIDYREKVIFLFSTLKMRYTINNWNTDA